MRLTYKEGNVIPLLTQTWEVAYLAEQGECWIPFCRLGQVEPIGEMHAASHQVRLFPEQQVVDRQLVVLSPPT